MNKILEANVVTDKKFLDEARRVYRDIFNYLRSHRWDFRTGGWYIDYDITEVMSKYRNLYGQNFYLRFTYVCSGKGGFAIDQRTEDLYFIFPYIAKAEHDKFWDDYNQSFPSKENRMSCGRAITDKFYNETKLHMNHFIHEIIHFLDSYRVKGKRTDIVGRYHKARDDEYIKSYYNDNLELNAYYQQTIDALSNVSENEKVTWKNGFDNLIKSINKLGIIKWDKLTDKNKKKYKTRLYNYWIDYISGKKVNETVDYIDDVEILINPEYNEFRHFMKRNNWYRVLLSQSGGFAIWSDEDNSLLHSTVAECFDIEHCYHLFARNNNVYFEDTNYYFNSLPDDEKQYYLQLAEELDNNETLKKYFPKIHMKQDILDMINGKQIIEESQFYDYSNTFYYTTSPNTFLTIIKNKFKGIPARVYYDFNKKLFVFSDARYVIHSQLMYYMTLNTNVYKDEEKKWDKIYYHEGEWQEDYLMYHYLKPNAAMFQIIWDTDVDSHDWGDKYIEGYWAKYKDFYIICRDEEYRKCNKIPLFYNLKFWSQKYNNMKTSKLNEAILDAKSVGDDLMNIILKNPTRKELSDNKMNTCRGAMGHSGNFYFISLSQLAHCDLFDTLEKLGIDDAPYNTFKYSNKTNTFYYYDPDNDLDFNLIRKELESSPYFKNFAGCKFDTFDDTEFDPDMYEGYNPLNEWWSGGINWTNDMSGLGAVGATMECKYFFFMFPDQFLNLCPKFSYGDEKFFTKYILSKKPVGIPFLWCEIDNENKTIKVFDHEGRHRVKAIRDYATSRGKTQPDIPVAIIYNKDKYSLPLDIDELRKNWKIVSQDGKTTYNVGQFTVQNNLDNARTKIGNLYETQQSKLNDNFWKWFGKSKCVDKNGNPVIYYHATNEDFNVFDNKKIKKGKGFWFTNNKQYALEHGRNVISAYLRTNNVFDVDLMEDVISKYTDNPEDLINDKETQDKLLKDGYDSIAFNNKHGRTIIVFNPNQIKSVNNKGIWSSESNNIYETVDVNVYHGSPNVFKKFDKRKLGTSTKKFEDGKYSSTDYGFFFTNDKEYASGYGENNYKCNIKLNNPLVVDMSDYIATEEVLVKFLQQAKNENKDGVIFKNIREVGRNPSTEYVVFNSNNIKILNTLTESKLNNNFWKWFGKSKCVDEFGNPKVFIHRTNSKFDTFDKSKIGQRDVGWYGRGFYFGSAKPKDYRLYGKHIMKCYLKMENPYIYDIKDYDTLGYCKKYVELGIANKNETEFINLFDNLVKNFDKLVDVKTEKEKIVYNGKVYNGKRYILSALGKTYKTDPMSNIDEQTAKIQFFNGLFEKYNDKLDKIKNNLFKRSDKFSEAIRKLGYDGIIKGDEYIVFEPNQIKSVDNGGDWSPDNNNINESVDKIDILKNPTRKELLNSNLSWCRYCYDNNGNYYFADANYTHNDIMLNIKGKLGIQVYDDMGFYDVDENCFYIRIYFNDKEEYDYYLDREKKIKQSSPLLKKLFGNFDVKIFSGEEPNVLNESVNTQYLYHAMWKKQFVYCKKEGKLFGHDAYEYAPNNKKVRGRKLYGISTSRNLNVCVKLKEREIEEMTDEWKSDPKSYFAMKFKDDGTTHYIDKGADLSFVVLVFDYNKLKQNHKIVPYSYVGGTMRDTFGDEQEELIIGDIPNFMDYVVNVIEYNNNVNRKTLKSKDIIESKIWSDELEKYIDDPDEPKKEEYKGNPLEVAVKIFGTTNNINECGYILTDGKMLDFSGKRTGGSRGTRGLDHRQIMDIGMDMMDFCNLGNIRYMPESNWFMICKLPTEQQFKVISAICRMTDGELSIEMMKDANNWGNSNKTYHREYMFHTPFAKIRRDIENYFK